MIRIEEYIQEEKDGTYDIQGWSDTDYDDDEDDFDDDNDDIDEDDDCHDDDDNINVTIAGIQGHADDCHDDDDDDCPSL